MSEWINVNDKLPEHEIDANGDGIQYIICMEDYVTVAYFMKRTDLKAFYDYDCEGRYYWYEGVTHWRYMPEPPEKTYKE